MPEEHLINSVNQHYLDGVTQLADAADIKATEDIFDARGMKLVAKGTKISHSLQEKLCQRRLNKPLESSIAVAAGDDANIITAEAQRIVDTVEPVRSILQAVNGPSPMQVLSGETVRCMSDSGELKSQKANHLLAEVLRRTTKIQHAFSSTGLDTYLEQASGFLERFSKWCTGPISDLRCSPYLTYGCASRSDLVSHTPF